MIMAIKHCSSRISGNSHLPRVSKTPHVTFDPHKDEHKNGCGQVLTVN